MFYQIMKNLKFLILIILTGCSQHYDWYIDKYLVAKVDNESTHDVKMAFCTTDDAVVSKVEIVPANQRGFVSKTFIKTRVDKNSDRPQNYQITEYSSNTYAALSDLDLNFVKLCVNSETFLVIDKANVCSSDFKDFDQKQNPCTVTF